MLATTLKNLGFYSKCFHQYRYFPSAFRHVAQESEFSNRYYLLDFLFLILTIVLQKSGSLNAINMDWSVWVPRIRRARENRLNSNFITLFLSQTSAFFFQNKSAKNPKPPTIIIPNCSMRRTPVRRTASSIE